MKNKDIIKKSFAMFSLCLIFLLSSCSNGEDYPINLPLELSKVEEINIFNTTKNIASNADKLKIIEAINSVDQFMEIDYQHEIAPPESEIIIEYNDSFIHIFLWEDSLLFNYEYVFKNEVLSNILSKE
jgi:hypothetical protein